MATALRAAIETDRNGGDFQAAFEFFGAIVLATEKERRIREKDFCLNNFPRMIPLHRTALWKENLKQFARSQFGRGLRSSDTISRVSPPMRQSRNRQLLFVLKRGNPLLHS